MNIHHYYSSGGKDYIDDYLTSLPPSERNMGDMILMRLQTEGLSALQYLNTRQLQRKLWEIKFADNRLMYVIADEDNMYIVHACRKQKGKAELFELRKAISRAKEVGQELDIVFV